MKILLTNDDGIDAAGINTLFDVLSSEHTVYMFAPANQKSACSNAINVHSPVRVDFKGKNRFAVHGYTADCVYIGLISSLAEPVDLVISGINHGPNLGNDIHYSGTVGGARTGQIAGISSLAVSLNSHDKGDNLINCAQYIKKYIEEHNPGKSKKPYFLNINYPDVSPELIKGEKTVKLGRRNYVNSYFINEESDSHLMISLKGELQKTEEIETDTSEIDKGFITITPLLLDATDYESIKAGSV